MKKYILERYRDEYEDYVSIALNEYSEDQQEELEEQDGKNWYCKKSEFDFQLTDSLDHIIKFLEDYYHVIDVRVVGLTPAEEEYIEKKLNYGWEN